MGRRSINTTKSGKYMNPTDQARKEARKKELKKNKKQRQMVRAAVLKGKDPIQLISEMEKIDQMEYNVLQPPPLNEKVLKDKRKKLKETLDRVMGMYDKDDPDKWIELKRMEMEYEKRRVALVTFAESVRHAQQVQVDEIPLPSHQLPSDSNIFMNLPSQIPLPADLPTQMLLAGVPLPPGISLPPPPGILKKTTLYPSEEKPKKCPGVPPGIPPELSSDEDETETEVVQPKKRSRTIRFADDEDKKDDEEVVAPKPTSLQQKMLAMAGQDIDQFMKEMEEVHRKREQDRGTEVNSKNTQNEDGSSDKEKEDNDDGLQPPGTGQPPKDPPPAPTPSVAAAAAVVAAAAAQAQAVAASHQPPPMVAPMVPLMYRPPPMGIRLPPGPPPGRPSLPPGPPPGLPPRMGLRLPPGPPPGMPPRMLRPPGPPPRMPGLMQPGMNHTGPTAAAVAAAAAAAAHALNPNVLSAAPQLISRPSGSQSNIGPELKKQGATIEAKPQIRNLSADVTRFLPTALRVKREENLKRKPFKTLIQEPRVDPLVPKAPSAGGQQTKDDAYMQFMREMEGLL